MKLRGDGSLHPAALLGIPLQPEVRCVHCGANLNGKLHQDTPAGPVCLGACEPREHQQALDLAPPRE